jgi:hypothetical protein
MQKKETLCVQHILICSSLATTLLITPLVQAQSASSSKAAPVDAGERANNETAAVQNDKPQVVGEVGKISLHFTDKSVSEAFKLIEKQGGVRISFSKDVDVRIASLSLSDVTVDAAISFVARAAGLLSIKTGDKTYMILNLVPGSARPPVALPKESVPARSEYSLRMFEPGTSIDPKMIIRGNANYSSKFIVPPPSLNLDEKLSPTPSLSLDGKLLPRIFVLPRGGRNLLPQHRMLPIPNRGSRRYDLSKSPNLLKLPQLKPGPLSGLPFIIVPNAAQQPQFNTPRHR